MSRAKLLTALCHCRVGAATECLADVCPGCCRTGYDAIVPDLRHGTVLIAAHGNSLPRAESSHLDGLSDEAVVALNVPTGIRCATSSTR